MNNNKEVKINNEKMIIHNVRVYLYQHNLSHIHISHDSIYELYN